MNDTKKDERSDQEGNMTTQKNGYNALEALKRCPFCGSEVVLMNLLLPMQMFYCKNYDECGAVISFDNPKCNTEKGNENKIRCFNRRAI